MFLPLARSRGVVTYVFLLLTALAFSGGLNPQLPDALKAMAVYIPSIANTINDKLLDELSLILTGQVFQINLRHRPVSIVYVYLLC